MDLCHQKKDVRATSETEVTNKRVSSKAAPNAQPKKLRFVFREKELPVGNVITNQNVIGDYGTNVVIAGDAQALEMGVAGAQAMLMDSSNGSLYSNVMGPFTTEHLVDTLLA